MQWVTNVPEQPEWATATEGPDTFFVVFPTSDPPSAFTSLTSSPWAWVHASRKTPGVAFGSGGANSKEEAIASAEAYRLRN
jgi:hypothetical protein